jgi:hypothetical protein
VFDITANSHKYKTADSDLNIGELRKYHVTVTRSDESPDLIWRSVQLTHVLPHIIISDLLFKNGSF